MYQPTNEDLIQQADEQYYAQFDIKLKIGESLTEIGNFIVNTARVIVFDVTGTAGEGTITITKQSNPFTREDEHYVDIIICKGGKVVGVGKVIYA